MQPKPSRGLVCLLSASLAFSLVLGCTAEDGSFDLEPADDAPVPGALSDPEYGSELLGEVRIHTDQSLAEISNPNTVVGAPIETGDGADDGSNNRAAGPARGQAWLYQHSLFGGWRRTVTGYDLSYIGSSYNDQVSSLRVGPDTCVTLFQDSSYGGTYKSICSDVIDLSLFGMNDMTSSVRLYPQLGWVWLFTGVHYAGAMVAYNFDVAALPTSYNDKVRSVKVGYLSSASLSKLNNWGGQAFEIDSHTPDLAAVGITGISSTRVLPARGWAWFYDGYNYSGDLLPLPWAISVLHIFGKDSGGNFDDAIESIKVGPNTEVRLFEHPDFEGWKYETTSSVPALPTSYRNKASSASVFMRSW